jgi:hypothetical protein
VGVHLPLSDDSVATRGGGRSIQRPGPVEIVFRVGALVIVVASVVWIILTRRLQMIEEQLAWVRSLAKLTDATQVKESTVYELMGRVSALEKHTHLMTPIEKTLHHRILKQEEEKLAERR